MMENSSQRSAFRRSSFGRWSVAALFLPLTIAAGVVDGVARAEDSSYEIQKSTTTAAVGVPGKAALTVKGKNGWHLNEQAPISVTAKAAPGVELPKPKLVRADLAESTKEAARFEIPFAASAPGKKIITAEARFVMCQEQACKPMKETVALEVDVDVDVAATPPAGASKPGAAKKKPTTATP